jgi:hypothetical protein
VEFSGVSFCAFLLYFAFFCPILFFFCNEKSEGEMFCVSSAFVRLLTLLYVCGRLCTLASYRKEVKGGKEGGLGGGGGKISALRSILRGT